MSHAPTSQAPAGLILSPNLREAGKRYFRDFTPGDDFYEALIDMHQGLSDEDSERVNARLILLLSNATPTALNMQASRAAAVLHGLLKVKHPHFGNRALAGQ